MTKTLLIFDFDGVLVDSEVLAAKAVSKTLQECGIDLGTDQVIDRYVGISTPSMMKMIEGEFQQTLPTDFAARIHNNIKALIEPNLTEVPGANAALSKLSGPRCIASSTSLKGIRRSLRVTDLARHFADNALFSAEMVANGKPSPDLFLHAAREMGAKAGDCIVIEDSIPGVTGAAAAGMHVIGFAGGSHIRDGHHERLRTAGAGLVFDDMALLPRILADLQAS